MPSIVTPERPRPRLDRSRGRVARRVAAAAATGAALVATALPPAASAQEETPSALPPTGTFQVQSLVGDRCAELVTTTGGDSWELAGEPCGDQNVYQRFRYDPMSMEISSAARPDLCLTGYHDGAVGLATCDVETPDLQQWDGRETNGGVEIVTNVPAVPDEAHMLRLASDATLFDLVSWSPFPGFDTLFRVLPHDDDIAPAEGESPAPIPAEDEADAIPAP